MAPGSLVLSERKALLLRHAVFKAGPRCFTETSVPAPPSPVWGPWTSDLISLYFCFLVYKTGTFSSTPTCRAYVALAARARGVQRAPLPAAPPVVPVGVPVVAAWAQVFRGGRGAGRSSSFVFCLILFCRSRGWRAFSVKGHVADVFGLEGRTVPFPTLQLALVA